VLLPVMVFIYGGSFNSGDNKAANYGPHYLLDKNIVLVTINYRLNVLGEFNGNKLKYDYHMSATTHHL
jgi:carboxylesterase type B